MPELPEVETIRRELQAAVRGKKIEGVQILNAKVVRSPAQALFRKGITGRTIRAIHRRAKLLALELSGKKFLTVHLKMTGQFIYPETSPVKETRVVFRFSDKTSLAFRDRRMFGELRLVDDWLALSFVRSLGPEPQDLTQKQFSALLAGRKTKIKPLLMDQTVIAGIGNLYAAEALFRAKIMPDRSAGALSDKEQSLLFREIRATLKEATLHKGSSVDQYVQLTGEPGEYVPYHKVYDRQGQPCRRCKTKIKRTTLGGRGTYFCPRCQK